MPSAEDAFRARMANEQASREQVFREEAARCEQFWSKLQAETRAALRRLEAKGWPGGQLETIPGFSTSRRASKSPSRTELVVWKLGGVYTYNGLHEYTIALYLGSDGTIYYGKDWIKTELTKATSLLGDWSAEGLGLCLQNMKHLGR